jgi:hypothetical protein
MKDIAQSNKAHYIMNKDIPVIRIEDATVLNEEMSPHSLQVENLNFSKILKWISYRALPMTRQNADKIYRAINIPRESMEYELMSVTRGLSVNDNFWIASGEDIENIKYEDIDLFTHNFNRDLCLVALRGDEGIVVSNEALSAEYTGQGNYPKCFVKEQDGIYLYKSGKTSEIRNEIYAGYIANILGLNTVQYEYRKFENIDCSVSKIVTGLDNYWESAFILSEVLKEKTGLIPQDYAASNFSTDYSNMVIFDGIILNGDRHMKNWSFEFDANTNEIIGLAPSYDYNGAFMGCNVTDSMLIFNGYYHVNILKAARIAYQNYGTTLNLNYLLDVIDNLDIDINKEAMKNRILYITGSIDNQRDCY